MIVISVPEGRYTAEKFVSILESSCKDADEPSNLILSDLATIYFKSEKRQRTADGSPFVSSSSHDAQRITDALLRCGVKYLQIQGDDAQYAYRTMDVSILSLLLKDEQEERNDVAEQWRDSVEIVTLFGKVHRFGAVWHDMRQFRNVQVFWWGPGTWEYYPPWTFRKLATLMTALPKLRIVCISKWDDVTATKAEVAEWVSSAHRKLDLLFLHSALQDEERIGVDAAEIALMMSRSMQSFFPSLRQLPDIVRLARAHESWTFGPFGPFGPFGSKVSIDVDESTFDDIEFVLARLSAGVASLRIVAIKMQLTDFPRLLKAVAERAHGSKLDVITLRSSADADADFIRRCAEVAPCYRLNICLCGTEEPRAQHRSHSDMQHLARCYGAGQDRPIVVVAR